MLVKLSLIVAMCSNVSMTQVQTKAHELEKQYGGKVTVRFDKKAECDAKGNIIPKVRASSQD